MSDNENDQKPIENPIQTTIDKVRRRFLILISLGAGAVATGVAATPIVTFLLAPLFKKAQPGWRPVGYLKQFNVGDTVEVSLEDSSPQLWGGSASKSAAWLRRDGEAGFTCFSVDCTHLGCPVRWEPEAQLFLCPCHGGVYYSNGDVAAGPPPDPLQQYPVRINGDVVEVEWKVLPAVAACEGCGDRASRNPRSLG